MISTRHPPPVSIHAPARGATELQRLQWQDIDVFQSTPLREGRQLNYNSLINKQLLLAFCEPLNKQLIKHVIVKEQHDIFIVL